jgi:hypothetical protein
LYKEYISIKTSNNSCILGCCELSFRCVFFFLVNNMDFEILTLVFQVVDHLTYNSIVCYCFDFL